MARRYRPNGVEDDATQFLTLFYHYISWRCEPGSRDKLQQLLTTLESLANDKNKLEKLKREIWRQFRDDEIFCQISRNSRRH